MVSWRDSYAARDRQNAWFGAYGACAGIVALYGFVAYLVAHTPTSGIDATEAHVAWLSLGGLTVGLLIAHHVIGRQLLLIAREGNRPQPLGAK